MAKLSVADRLNGNYSMDGLKKDSQVDSVATQARNALTPASASAANYAVSLLLYPESDSDPRQVVKAIRIAANLATPDVIRTFTPAATATPDDQAAHYRRQIAELAGPDPLAFSGKKVVVISVREKDSAAMGSLRREAKSRAHFGMSPDALLAASLNGKLAGPDGAMLQSMLAAVLAQQESELWIHDSGSLPETAAVLGYRPAGAGGAGLDQAAGGTAKAEKPALDAVSVIATDGTDVRGVRTRQGSETIVDARRKALGDLAAQYPDSTAVARLAHVAHPHALITTAQDASSALDTVTMLRQNPWYRKNATIVALLETANGTDLLTF
jgi:hypothetical protein